MLSLAAAASLLLFAPTATLASQTTSPNADPLTPFGRFQLLSEPTSWADYPQACKEAGYAPASIDFQADKFVLSTLVPLAENKSVWIYAYRNGDVNMDFAKQKEAGAYLRTSKNPAKNSLKVYIERRIDRKFQPLCMDNAKVQEHADNAFVEEKPTHRSTSPPPASISKIDFKEINIEPIRVVKGSNVPLKKAPSSGKRVGLSSVDSKKGLHSTLSARQGCKSCSSALVLAGSAISSTSSDDSDSDSLGELSSEEKEMLNDLYQQEIGKHYQGESWKVKDEKKSTGLLKQISFIEVPIDRSLLADVPIVAMLSLSSIQNTQRSKQTPPLSKNNSNKQTEDILLARSSKPKTPVVLTSIDETKKDDKDDELTIIYKKPAVSVDVENDPAIPTSSPSSLKDSSVSEPKSSGHISPYQVLTPDGLDVYSDEFLSQDQPNSKTTLNLLDDLYGYESDETLQEKQPNPLAQSTFIPSSPSVAGSKQPLVINSNMVDNIETVETGQPSVNMQPAAFAPQGNTSN
jgi:hypothetical protein